MHMADFTFATGAMGYGDAETVYMLCRSIRDFGGGFQPGGYPVAPRMYIA